MAKGQAQQADKQLKTTNQIGANELGQANKLEGTLIPDYTSMLTQGYTPAQESAMTTAGMGGVASAGSAADQSLRNDAARTNNAASLTAGEDQNALNTGVAAGNEAAGLQKSFADQQQANQKAGLAGLYGLQSGNEATGAQMYGLSPGLLGARAAGQNTGLQIAGDILGAAGAAAS